MLDLAARKTGIGGSDAAAALGLSHWKTPLMLYQEKLPDAPIMEIESEPMKWGKILEPVIRQEYANRTGYDVTHEMGKIQSDQYAYMFINLDGVAITQGRVAEFKTSRSSDGWGEEGTDEIPQEYLVQVMHAMIVTKLEVADVAVLIGGSDYRQYEVPADKELMQLIIDQEAEFWSKVQNRMAPDPVNSDDVRRLYATSKEKSILATDEMVSLANDLRLTKAAGKELEAEEDAIKFKLQDFMKDNDTIVGPDGKPLITWKSAKGSVLLDSDMVKSVYPDVYKACTKERQGSRRFLVK